MRDTFGFGECISFIYSISSISTFTFVAYITFPFSLTLYSRPLQMCVVYCIYLLRDVVCNLCLHATVQMKESRLTLANIYMCRANAHLYLDLKLYQFGSLHRSQFTHYLNVVFGLRLATIPCVACVLYNKSHSDANTKCTHQIIYYLLVMVMRAAWLFFLGSLINFVTIENPL